ncbi:MAG: flagellar basal body-associated FliL family protein [Mesorhizobium sp.]|nr:flagellar basal body-associated FliL family protein [Mesorhizobium sp.]
MAKAVAIVDPNAPAAKGPSIVVQIAILLVLTGIAAGIGLFAGNVLNGSPEASHGKPAGAAHGKTEHAGDPAEADAKRGIVQLTAITTNLAAPGDTWVRMEAAVVFEGEPDLAVADLVQQDLIAFLRTVKLHQVEGASGFQHLKSDMEERASIRSDGKVKALLIKTLLFE